MTRTIASTLARSDPAHAPLYAANRDREIASLTVLEGDLRTGLVALHGRPYLVFHDAYRYFEHRFGLTPAGAVTAAPERPVGPKRIEALHGEALRGHIACIFSEPQFSPRLTETILEGTAVRTGVLDPLGAELAPGPDLYGKLLRSLAASLNSCLAIPAKNR
jgi:zinc transport system substrate-binding protein